MVMRIRLLKSFYEDAGNGIPQDAEKATFYFQKSVEQMGAVEGWLALGRLNYLGKSVPKDYEKAFYYY